MNIFYSLRKLRVFSFTGFRCSLCPESPVHFHRNGVFSFIRNIHFSRKKGRNNLDDPNYAPWILKMSLHKIEPWKKKFMLDGEDRHQKKAL